jgi:acetylornithine deacetylase/succinyl-diaminopimelate desuccinylase-like protein
MLAPGQPAIIYALRGNLSLELHLHGPQHDLHSGGFGGAVVNPLQILCEFIAHLHDAQGHIAIPGFYDAVRSVSEKERNYLQEHGPSNQQLLNDAEISTGWGEAGYSLFDEPSFVRHSPSMVWRAVIKAREAKP